MIKFADENTKPLVRQMWKTCFEDTDEFLDILFKYKYRNENTLIYFEEGEAVASLQMLPYTITFYGKIIPFAYMAGLCTLPEHRNKGYMPRLIGEAHRILKERNIPLAILVPAEDWLYQYYEKFEYTQVFDEGTEPIYPIEKILTDFPEINDAYLAYTAIYEHEDFCVQKSFDDFKAIAEEQRMDGFPPKYNLPGMACIINEITLLNLYADKNLLLSLCMEIENEKSNHLPDSTIMITNGSARYTEKSEPDITMSMKFLCRLLFGYRTDELSEPYKTLFPARQPIMNQMLE
ncbi:GNAT family N-acetyltransferase [Dysgonomonas sp. Marseille-P4677]|uniref:GNAT family N-acetyltransferase n=1 Tax=Dysgonomonas sp. Marseille-P4677 TaxID=2364790 RepID=UPI001911B0C8|nr:GNAT family N-acetyltransferase [Dysgonomonas sp. Marseille-P4677]MBK5720818.1 GNAT family N-acetyltransferase [Dysgonomonas sp. Marseille-P4677]